MFLYDLQVHTNLSDGDYPLTMVLEQAKHAGLKGLAITDHNIALGVNERAEECRTAGFEAVSAVEISAKFEGFEVHVLGYAQRFDEAVLQKGLQETLDGYDKRFRQTVVMINQSGLAKLDFEAIKSKKGPGTCVVKYDIAQVLAPQIGKSTSEAVKLMNRGSQFFVPYGEWAMLPSEAVQLIHQAGGLAIFSHPGETERKAGSEIFARLLASMRTVGLDGLEVFSAKHNTQEQDHFLQMAQSQGFSITGGSDYHGDKHHPELTLGLGGLTVEQYQQFVAKLPL